MTFSPAMLSQHQAPGPGDVETVVPRPVKWLFYGVSLANVKNQGIMVDFIILQALLLGVWVAGKGVGPLRLQVKILWLFGFCIGDYYFDPAYFGNYDEP